MDTARLELAYPASRPPGGELLHVTYSVLGAPDSIMANWCRAALTPLCAGALPLGHVSWTFLDERLGK